MNEVLGDRDDTVEHANNTNKNTNNKNNETTQKELAKDAVSQFLIQKAAAGLLEDDFSRIHGVAVWALAADVNSKVRYHIDYAELIRYEHNIIYPPLYAGTIQCTKTVVKGGDFRVNTDGLDHYEEYGYKGKKKKKKSADTMKNDDDSSWVTIPYRYNQGIIHNGDYPHESTLITFLTPNTKRVIMGFNVFGHDVGPLVQAAPEHSSAFNRRVKLYRAMARVVSNAAAVNTKGSAFDGNDTQKKPQNIDMQLISKNKALRKLLVLAKREKVKSDLKKQQRQITLGVFNALMENEQNPNGATSDCGSAYHGSSSSLTVSELVQRIFSKHHRNLAGGKEKEVSPESDGNLVRPVDVRVHISLMVRNAAKYGIQVVSSPSCDYSEKGCLYDESGMILDTVRLSRRASKTDSCEALE